MGPQMKLRSLAAEYAQQRQNEIARIEGEVAKLRAEVAKKEKELTWKKDAPRRTETYDPGSMPEFNCPSCWIDDEKKIPLRNKTGDDWDCRRCNLLVDDLTG